MYMKVRIMLKMTYDDNDDVNSMPVVIRRRRRFGCNPVNSVSLTYCLYIPYVAPVTSGLCLHDNSISHGRLAKPYRYVT